MTEPETDPAATEPPAKNPLRAMDDAARRLGKTLLRRARHGALAVLEPGNGAPSASRVNTVADMDGRPVFLASKLSPHWAALEADPRAGLMVGEPGKGDPLAHPRLSLTGRVARIADPDERARLRGRFLGRHPKSALYVDFGDMGFWRLTPERLSLNGGYGQAFAPEPADLATDLSACPDLPKLEADAVAHMNADHADAVDRYAESLGAEGRGWRLASLDPEGLDLVLGDQMARLWFDAPLPSAAALRPVLIDLARA